MKPTITVLDAIHCKADKRTRRLILPVLSYETTVWRRGLFGHKQKQTVTAHLITGRHGSSGTFLTGLLPRIQKTFGNKIRIVNKESHTPSNRLPKLKHIKFRPDQRKALRSARRHQRGIILMPTGSGKTIIALGIMSIFKDHRILFLCHTEVIIEQTASAIRKHLRIEPHIIGGGHKTNWNVIRKDKRPIVLATIQSFAKIPYGRYSAFFDITITDECFAKNTLIQTANGEVLIQNIYIGNRIWAKNKIRRVINTFKIKVSLDKIIKITFSNKTIIFCTKDHLFWINNKWEFAYTISGKKIFRFENKEYLYEKIQEQAEDQETKKMSNMQNFIYNQMQKANLLLSKMLSQQSKKQQKNIGQNENEQPFFNTWSNKKGNRYKKAKWNIMGWKAWWQWATYQATIALIFCLKLANGNRNQNRTSSLRPKWLSVMLQSRHREQKNKTGNRGGWNKTHRPKAKKIRCQKRKQTASVRVDNIEIYKRGSNDESFKSIISNKEKKQGYATFFDLEVERENCYFAEKILVHNCHHANSLTSQYGKVMTNNLSPRRYGLTATMPTTQREILVNEGLIGPPIAELTVQEGIKIGIIAKPIINLIEVPFRTEIDNVSIKYPDAYEYGIVRNKRRNMLIIDEIKNNLLNKETTLIIIERTRHGTILRNLLRNKNIKVKFVHGSTSKEVRLTVKNNLKRGKIKVVICSKIWKEAINIPTLRNIINACGMKEEKAVIQAIGRGLRTAKNKKIVKITDFIDPYKYLKKHSEERIKIYKKHGWL